jgi:hypothetical protein
MTDLDRLHERAGFLFKKLKETLIEIETLGERPIVITHDNGMLDSFRVDPAYPTTPVVDAIRASKVHSR